MYTARIAKIIMVACLAAFCLLVVFGNLTDYQSNFLFVQHVMSMDTTYPGNKLMYRAVTEPAYWQAAYTLIIFGEATAGLLLLIALHVDFVLPSYLDQDFVVWILLLAWAMTLIADAQWPRRQIRDRMLAISAACLAVVFLHSLHDRPWSLGRGPFQRWADLLRQPRFLGVLREVLYERRAAKNEGDQQPERADAHAREAALPDPGLHHGTPPPSTLPASR